jgi:hypothetical protein
MPYPTSTDVAAGQPTSYLHYNSLRADALYLGQLPADAVNLLDALARYSHNLAMEPLATDRVRIPYAAFDPCVLMIDGHLCKAAADVDLPALAFSGVAATWYIFANWTAGSTTFALTANTSLTETAGTRRIARIDWDGSHLVYPSLLVYNQGRPGTYRCTVRRVAAQTITPAGTYCAVSWDTKDADTDGMYSAGTPTKVNIVHTGLYLITAVANWANLTNIKGGYLLVNADATKKYGASGAAASSYAYTTLSQCMWLNAGDYVEFYLAVAVAACDTAALTTMTVAALSA